MEYKAGHLGRALRFEHRTLPDLLTIQSHLGDKVMIQFGEKKITYGQAPEIAGRYAAKLISAGVRPGDRVITLMSSRLEQLELWFGISWAGAVMVPINTAFRGEQLRHAIKIAEPTLIIIEEGLIETLYDVSDAFQDLQAIYVLDEPQDQALVTGRVPTIEHFNTDMHAVESYPVKPGDIAAILYTSGTTGPSKGVLCPHAQFFWWAVNTGESLELSEEDVLYTVLPLFHTNALNALWQSIAYGAEYSFSPRFSASKFWTEAKACKATVTFLLGAMAQILLKQTPSEIESSHRVRAALCPATPLQVVQEFGERMHVKLIEGYGSTETNLVFSNVVGGYAPSSMGRVVDGFEVRIVDENDIEVKDGESGELIIRNSEPFSMSSGYIGNPEATVKAWRNLWFHTGDRVLKDAAGIYYFQDRLVDSIRRRGENISSWEVENALMEYPDIEVAAVFGVPSDLGSEEDVMTAVVMAVNHEPDLSEIVRFLESRLAYFAIPRYWRFTSKLPTTENGKIRKNVLREAGVKAAAWDLEKTSIKVDRSPASR